MSSLLRVFNEYGPKDQAEKKTVRFMAANGIKVSFAGRIRHGCVISLPSPLSGGLTVKIYRLPRSSAQSPLEHIRIDSGHCETSSAEMQGSLGM